MTMQHFQAIADVLANNKEGIEAITFSRMVSQFAVFCREHNDNFNRDCFTAVCYRKEQVNETGTAREG